MRVGKLLLAVYGTGGFLIDFNCVFNIDCWSYLVDVFDTNS